MLDIQNKPPIKPPCPDSCQTIGRQRITVCMPVCIEPKTEVGQIKVKCCDAPFIDSKCNHCDGKEKGKCEFVISQVMEIEIPVKFTADVDLGKTFVDCDLSTDGDFLMGCSNELFDESE